MAKRIGLWALLFGVVFLAGFLPQYFQRVAVEKRLVRAERVNAQAGLRDLAALACIQAAQKNYGLAAQTSTEFFSRVQKMAAETTGSPAKQTWDDILGYRDRITAELAKGDPAALADLQTLYVNTRSSTQSGS